MKTLPLLAHSKLLIPSSVLLETTIFFSRSRPTPLAPWVAPPTPLACLFFQFPVFRDGSLLSLLLNWPHKASRFALCLLPWQSVLPPSSFFSFTAPLFPFGPSIAFGVPLVSVFLSFGADRRLYISMAAFFLFPVPTPPMCRLCFFSNPDLDRHSVLFSFH